MPKEKLSLLDNADNFFRFPQATIDQYKIADEDVTHILDSVRLFSNKIKDHFAYKTMTKQLNIDLSNFQFIDLPKYPLPAAFNIPTKKIIINTSVWGRRNILNIEPRDMYAVILYGYVCAYYSVLSMEKSLETTIANFISTIYIKMFAKKYGLVGSYQGELPRLRFFVTMFVMVSFFDKDPKTAAKGAANMSGVTSEQIGLDLNDYDFTVARDLVRVLSESGVLNGITTYEFVSSIMRRFTSVVIPMFEDPMRFMATMAASTIPSNSLFSNSIRLYNMGLYNRIIIDIEKRIK